MAFSNIKFSQQHCRQPFQTDPESSDQNCHLKPKMELAGCSSLYGDRGSFESLSTA